MAMQLARGERRLPLENLVNDYLCSGRARGLAPKSDKQYTYALCSVFLPWCEREGIDRIDHLDRHALDRFTASLFEPSKIRWGIVVEALGSHIPPPCAAHADLGEERG